MKIELTAGEFEDMLTCASCGVYLTCKWLADAMNDEFSTPEDVEHYDELERRIKALNEKLRDMYGKNI